PPAPWFASVPPLASGCSTLPGAVPVPAPEPLGLVLAIMPPLASVPLTSGAGVTPVPASAAELAATCAFVPCGMLVPELVPVLWLVFCKASISPLQVPALAVPAASNNAAQTPKQSACLFMRALLGDV